MSKAEISYLDWELSFRREKKEEDKSQSEKENITSLGIPEDQFKNYLRKWKNENLK